MIGFAFPVRDYTSWEYLMKIADALSFLHGKGVQHVHMFGSCKPEIIIVGAAAIGLEVFKRITFDSSTWDTSRINPPKILEPSTLKQKDIRKLEVFRLMLPKSLIQKLKGYEQYIPRSYFYKLILLNNVLNVNRLTQKMNEMAKDVEQLKWFIKISADYEPLRDMLLHAIGLLQKAAEVGYDYIEKEFDFIWF